MTAQESHGFWKDIIDWYNDKFQGTLNQGGRGAGKAHPRGCRGCSDNKLSWWCGIYFTLLIIYEIVIFIIYIPIFIITIIVKSILLTISEKFIKFKIGFKMCRDCKYFTQCTHHYDFACISGIRQIEPCKSCEQWYPDCKQVLDICKYRKKHGTK
jgi:hypothetical protein